MTSEPEAPLPQSQIRERETSQGNSLDGSQPLRKAKHERFCRELATGKSQAEAFRLAGYNYHTANACRLSANESIKARTSYLMQRAAAKLEITSDRILQELALIGFARMQDYVPVLTTGDLTSITSEQSAAISEVAIITQRDGSRRAKLKLSSKREALVDLGKATGLFDDRPDITVPVTFMIKRSDRVIEHDDED